jgi:Rho-binding antiterminator
MPSEPYQPISCEFHDVLESLATKARRAPVVYVGDDGALHEVSAVITDLFGRDGVEFMVLDSGETVRLDRIVTVDGVRLADFQDGATG